MFDQFMGTTQAPPTSTSSGTTTKSGMASTTVPIVTPSRGDLVKEIRKRGVKEFLGDKGDDPIAAKQWLSRVCRVIKELKCMSGDSFFMCTLFARRRSLLVVGDINQCNP
ncbi:hypothetical protein ES288_A01G139000v1 [Gossypium darwinii]|uniref:Uncharacterized protein n=1 Tax=Gossypium darwinii TaxID=34276 RepID=A0A5D2HL17_GOSDA|nr:hypothetical protein ES288_A01G139000v1 [Gossypium darwinii]